MATGGNYCVAVSNSFPSNARGDVDTFDEDVSLPKAGFKLEVTFSLRELVGELHCKRFKYGDALSWTEGQSVLRAG
jgi:hypothetical protein